MVYLVWYPTYTLIACNHYHANFVLHYMSCLRIRGSPGTAHCGEHIWAHLTTLNMLTRTLLDWMIRSYWWRGVQPSLSFCIWAWKSIQNSASRSRSCATANTVAADVTVLSRSMAIVGHPSSRKRSVMWCCSTVVPAIRHGSVVRWPRQAVWRGAALACAECSGALRVVFDLAPYLNR